MKKSILGKKIIECTNTQGFLSFRNRNEFEKFYNKLESTCDLVNFRGEPFNWAAFCKKGNMSFKPQAQDLTIEIIIGEFK